MAAAAHVPVFRMENITMTFGGLNALAGVNLSVEESQIIGLIGPRT